MKAQVKHTARTLLECYNCHSLAEFNTLLNLYNVTVYEVRGNVDGNEYHGIMYGALDDNGQQVGTPFKSSKFGKVFGYEALKKKFAVSAEKMKKDNLSERTRQEITKAMQDIGTKEDFARRLKEADIEVVYRINSEGRLYGITFIDHIGRTVFNTFLPFFRFCFPLLTGRFQYRERIFHAGNPPYGKRVFRQSANKILV